MYTREQLEQVLKSEAKSAIFERDFAIAFNKYLNEKREGVNKTYAERKDWSEYRLQPAFPARNQPFTVEGDDAKLHKAKWSAFLQDAGLYYDLPTLQEQREMRFNLQHRYDDLFPGQWHPPLQSRHDLLQWVCE